MARQAAPISVELSIFSHSDAPKYAQIKEGIVRAIQGGALPPASRLPSTRQLAEHLRVARITVATAYELLEAEGWIRCRRGAGSYVRPVANPSTLAEIGNSGDGFGSARKEERNRPIALSDTGMPPEDSLPSGLPGWRDPRIQHAHSLAEMPGIISFVGTRQDPTLFPVMEVRRSLNTVLERDGALALQAEEPEGFVELRQAIAKMLEGMGVVLPWERWAVTSGSQQAIDLAARVLVEPGQVVLTEDPTFPGALEAFAARGARLVGLPMEENGLELEGLEASMWRYRPRVLYTNPTFHNPTGSTLPLERRQALLRLAAAHDCYVVEDDGYSLLRYGGAPPPPLAALAAEMSAADRVIYLGSLSNLLPPGLRLGYIGVPEPLQRAFVLAKQAADLHTSSLLQRAAAAYLQGDHLQAQLRRLRRAGRKRRDTMLRAWQRAQVPGLNWWRPAGGSSMWMSLPAGISARRLYTSAIERGVAFRIGAASYVGQPSYRTVQLSFLPHGPPAIEEGVRRLAALLKEWTDCT